jgi:acyl carrier protein phosphodiesterase
MNFLAHFYLSGNADHLLVGNFIGDTVKGSHIENYPIPIQEGIRMHRTIDSFTDTHPVVSESKNRLRPVFNHYASVIIDMFYDHILAKNWLIYSSEQLDVYAQQVYKTLDNNKQLMPPENQNMLSYMKERNWLLAYAEIEGIDRALNGMSRRTSFVSHMEKAATYLQNDYAFYEDEFQRFFPELIAHTEAFRKPDYIL